MRFLARTLLVSLLVLPILASAAIWLCFQESPSVVRAGQITSQDVDRAKRIIEQHDPRKARDGGPRTVTISEQDLDLILNYTAGRFAKGAARAALRPGAVRLQASAEVPHSAFRRYVNVTAVLGQTDTFPRFDSAYSGPT